ncbi:MAG: hypothetical protein PCFJNLEI_01842 [Verrucomicrobiae bacterium]|nr:hypothetical protein [Verrucomicrobiae bacterium]
MLAKCILFRAACSFHQGTGHLRRCLTLADELRTRGRRVAVITDANELAVQVARMHQQFVTHVAPEVFLPAAWLTKINRVEALVVDFPQSEESALRQGDGLATLTAWDRAGVPIVSLGHLAHLSHAFRAVVDLYPSSGVHAANYFEGPEFLILRPEFRAPRRSRAGRNRVLISMGGTDPHDLTRTALVAVLQSKWTGPVTVVLGGGYAAEREVELRRLATGRNVEFFRAIENMAALMRRCRLGIVPFGTTAYELMSQGVACLAVSHYRWQEPSARLFHELGACLYVGCAQNNLTPTEIANQFDRLASNPTRLTKLAQTGQRIVDGRGTERVAYLLEQFTVETRDRQLDRLYVLAHPGDEVFGCGGTILQQTRRGDRVGLVILGEGLGARKQDVDTQGAVLAERQKLKSTLQTVIEELGIRTWYYYQFADNRFDHHDLLDLVKVVESVVRRHNPHTVYTHHPGDLNVDHQRAFAAVMTATRPLAGQPVRSVFSIEVPSSSDWGNNAAEKYHPNWFENIAPVLEKKLALAARYASEIRPDPHPRSLAGLRARAEQWGRVAGLPAAETFVLQRHLQDNNPRT